METQECLSSIRRSGMKKGRIRSAALLLICCLLIQMAPVVQAAEDPTTFTGVDTVMIYNPDTDSESTMYTGNLSGQIDTTSKTVSLASQEEPLFMDRWELYDELDGLDLSGIPADEPGLMASYSVGDKKTFFAQPEETYKYQYGTFTCLYSGTHCLVWGFNYSNTTIAAAMGREFDQIIYPKDTEAFGTARYIKDGDKLNILIYPMYSTGLCGFFWPIELLTASEMGSSNAPYYNNSSAIIHINSYHCSPSLYRETGLVTIAHEYQHLICMSSTLLGNGRNSLTQMGTWLNESMSAAAEEWIYPGKMSDLGYISRNYNESGLIAKGQSLYDFTTSSTDIGVYGQALLFSEYLKQQGGAEVFSRIHNYWRTAASSQLTDGDALYTAIPETARQEIDRQINYNSDVESLLSNDQEEIFLSKLNLAFQVANILQESDGIYSTTDVCAEADPMRFTGSSCFIQGGGRVVVDTADGQSFTVPSSADDQLIYVGFRNGEMVVAPTTADDYNSASAYQITAVSNNSSMGTVSLSGTIITASPAAGYGYAVPAATVLSGQATVVRCGDAFTVTPSTDCTVQINFAPLSTGAVDTWDGTSQTPYFSEGAYYIQTAEQLAGLAQMVNGGNSLANTDVHLMADLDLAGRSWTPIGYRPTNSSLYADTVPFSGRFYGNGHVISGLSIGSEEAPYSDAIGAGLFGCVANPDEETDALISGLTIRDAEVYGTTYAGILIGYAWGANVSDCQVGGNVVGKSNVGGIAGGFGYNSSWAGTRSITRCFSSADVTATSSYAGGFAGYTGGVDISLCGATGHVTAASGSAGGFVGGDNSSKEAGFSNCYATGNVDGGTYYVGGFVGYASSTSTYYCYAAGSATGSSATYLVGGFSGNLGGSSFRSSYCDGDKTAFPIGDQGANNMMLSTDEMKLQSSYQGWDFNYTWIISPYANGGYPVLRWQTRQATAVVITGSKGCLAPGESLQLTVSLEPTATADQQYTIESSHPEVASVSATGLVTAHSTGTTTITATAVKGGAKGTFSLMVMDENTVAAGFGGGSGTAEDPFLVATVAHLEHLAAMVNYGYDFSNQEVLQINDLDLNGSQANPWTPIGTQSRPFRGTYNGNAHVISGLYADGAGLTPVGLFGVAENATIAGIDLKNATLQGGIVGPVVGLFLGGGLLDCCALDNVTVTLTGEGGSAGGIAGMVSAGTKISQVGFCASQADVTASVFGGKIGGIIGSSDDPDLQVVSCRSSGTVTYGDQNVLSVTAGGILGLSGGGYVLQCYSTGIVRCWNGGSSGGIVGASEGNTAIMACYSTAEVGSGTTGYGAGGILSLLSSGDMVSQCYFAGSYSSQGTYTYTPIARRISYGTISQCYHLDSSAGNYSSTGAYSRTSAQMQLSSTYSGWDFSDTWTFVSGENNGYPVLRPFHPYWDGTMPLFDRAAFSDGCKDVVVTLNTNGNALEGVRGLSEAQYEIGAFDSQTNQQLLIIRRDYLLTLDVGVHTLTAEFGANCPVDFQIQVTDTTPEDRYLFDLDSFTPGSDGQPGSANVLISAPKDGLVLCAAAVYDSTGKLENLGMETLTLSKGPNLVSLALDSSAGSTCRIFLLDGNTYAPLLPALDRTLVATQQQAQGYDPISLLQSQCEIIDN